MYAGKGMLRVLLRIQALLSLSLLKQLLTIHLLVYHRNPE